jgi:hypothetical protein
MSTHSGNKLTEEQIEQLIKRLRGVEHIEPIVTIEMKKWRRSSR